MTVEAVITKLRDRAQSLEDSELVGFLNNCADELEGAIAPKDLSSVQDGRCIAHFEPSQVKGLKLRVEVQVCFPGGNWQDEKWIYFWDGLREEFSDAEIFRICEDAAHKHYEQHQVDYVDLKAVGLYEEPYFDNEGNEVDYAGDECPKCDSTESIYISTDDEDEDAEDPEAICRCLNCGAVFHTDDEGSYQVE